MKITILSKAVQAFSGLSKTVQVAVISSTVTAVAVGGYFGANAIIDATASSKTTDSNKNVEEVVQDEFATDTISEQESSEESDVQEVEATETSDITVETNNSEESTPRNSSTATVSNSTSTVTPSQTPPEENEPETLGPVEITTKTVIGEYITITIPKDWTAEEVLTRPVYNDTGLIEFNIYNASGTKVFGIYAPEAMGWGGNACSNVGTYKAYSDYNPALYDQYIEDFIGCGCTGEPAALEIITYDAQTTFLGNKIRRTAGAYYVDTTKGDAFFDRIQDLGLPESLDLTASGVSFFSGGVYEQSYYFVSFTPTANDYVELETALSTAVSMK